MSRTSFHSSRAQTKNSLPLLSALCITRFEKLYCTETLLPRWWQWWLFSTLCFLSSRECPLSFCVYVLAGSWWLKFPRCHVYWLFFVFGVVVVFPAASSLLLLAKYLFQFCCFRLISLAFVKIVLSTGIFFCYGSSFNVNHFCVFFFTPCVWKRD